MSTQIHLAVEYQRDGKLNHLRWLSAEFPYFTHTKRSLAKRYWDALRGLPLYRKMMKDKSWWEVTKEAFKTAYITYQEEVKDLPQPEYVNTPLGRLVIRGEMDYHSISFRDYFLSSRAWEHSDISGRGLPDGITDTLRDLVDRKYNYDKTWFTLTELDKLIDVYYEKLKDVLKDSQINKRLTAIENKLNGVEEPKKEDDDEDYYDYEAERIETAEDCYYALNNTYQAIYTVCEEHGINGYEDIRVIAWIS